MQFVGKSSLYDDNGLSSKGEALIEKLEKTTSGSEARRLGRSIDGLNVDHWNRESGRIMKNLIRESFKQNPAALKKLFATGNSTLTHTQDKTKWGKSFPSILMEVRSELKSELSEEEDKKDDAVKTFHGKITSLKENQIFVFGSNEGSSRGGNPTHGAGTALIARNKFGAKQGQSKGLQGRSYAIVTKKHWNVEKSSTKPEIINEIKTLYDFAESNPNKEFLIAYDTKGKNRNGYTAQEMADMFSKHPIPSNIVFNDEFSELLTPINKEAELSEEEAKRQAALENTIPSNDDVEEVIDNCKLT
jgi:hypothetical protein